MAVWHEPEATGVCQLSSKVSIRKLFYDMFRGIDCAIEVGTGPVVDGKYSFKLNAIFDTDGDIDVREFLSASRQHTLTLYFTIASCYNNSLTPCHGKLPSGSFSFFVPNFCDRC